MTRFLFASDSFKGTISSARSAELLSRAAHEVFPDAVCNEIEVADGGEGTVDAVVSAVGGMLREVAVRDARGREAKAAYGLLPGNRAVIEMAAASGLPQLALADRNPLLTGTWGVGELIADAMSQGAREITLAIGGSATNDGGMGCMIALGARFLDANGNELAGTGADLAQVCSIDLTGFDQRVSDTTFSVMCDVDNPLLGERGATRVFGPQKGAHPAMVEDLERGMASYAQVLRAVFPDFKAMGPGMGAAGGLGAAASTFLHAELVPGVEQVLDLVGFNQLLPGCDLCVTGEGHADAQSAHGKVVSGVASRCRAAGVPCVALVGAMDASATELLDYGVDALVPAVIDVCTREEVHTHAERNYALAAQRLFALLKIGSGFSNG